MTTTIDIASGVVRITPEYLRAATGCNAAQASLYAPIMEIVSARSGIASTLARAAWIAQTAHETQRYTCLEENLYYTTAARLATVWPSRFRAPASAAEAGLERFADGKRNATRYLRAPAKLANFVYANRLGNGDEASGDGAAYLGRGLMMLTGRANYAAYERSSGLPVLAHPQLLADPIAAVDSAAWYWEWKSCGALAERRDWRAVCRAINGGDVGAAEREKLTLAALAAAGAAA